MNISYEKPKRTSKNELKSGVTIPASALDYEAQTQRKVRQTLKQLDVEWKKTAAARQKEVARAATRKTKEQRHRNANIFLPSLSKLETPVARALFFAEMDAAMRLPANDNRDSQWRDFQGSFHPKAVLRARTRAA